MDTPSIVFGFRPTVLVGLLLVIGIATVFWRVLVPRQLQGLRVAFPTGARRYEVHRVTQSVGEARRLLATSGMRFGVVAYLMALVGALLLIVELILMGTGIQEGMSAINLGLAIVLIAFTSLTSIGAALSAIVLPSIGLQRASLQHNDPRRRRSTVVLLGAWMALVCVAWWAMSAVETSWRTSITLVIALTPPVLAYGRVLGSSWHAMRFEHSRMAVGRASPFRGTTPKPRQQAFAMIVNINLVVMPLVALNTFVTLLIMLLAPDTFVHSESVALLPEYTEQATVMEEGGLLGFWMIEALSGIDDAAIRAPLVACVLLFLLLNVAIVGLLFVYEVARIMFLDLAEVSGRGGIRITDSRLLRAERSQQAKVLNFCFTGFAGQSMLLVALAALTFWDSINLPSGQACGVWEGTVCQIVEKDAMESLTWMLSAGGQVAFLAVWLRSFRVGQQLSSISFDAAAGDDRERLESMEDMIYLRRGGWFSTLANDDWSSTLQRFEDESHQTVSAGLEGIELSRRTMARMQVFAALGRWSEAEEEAISLIALSARRSGHHANALLAAASLAQRDFPEARSRLATLADDDLTTNRLRWFLALCQPRTYTLDADVLASLSVDPVTRMNIDLVERTAVAKAEGQRTKRDTALSRRSLLGDAARLRLEGASDRALSLIEDHIERFNLAPTDWLHGHSVRILLHLDEGRVATAGSLALNLPDRASRHPHFRVALNALASVGQGRLPASEPTGMTWIDESVGDWIQAWPSRHEVACGPVWTTRALRTHAWSANPWVLHDAPGASSTMLAYLGRPAAKVQAELSGRAPPKGLHTHLCGVLMEVGGYPIDLGLPGRLDIDGARKAGLLS
jgi:hypothetical protein